MATSQRQREERNRRSVLQGIAMFNEASGMPLPGAVGSDSSPETAKRFDDMMKMFVESLTDDVVFTSMNGYNIYGKEAVANDLIHTYRVLPGIQMEVQDLYAVGDQVVLYAFMAGNRTHGFMGLPPTDKAYRVAVGVFNSFDPEGRRKKALYTWGPLDLYFQLGFPAVDILSRPGESVLPRREGHTTANVDPGGGGAAWRRRDRPLGDTAARFARSPASEPGGKSMEDEWTEWAQLPMRMLAEGIQAILGRPDGGETTRHEWDRWEAAERKGRPFFD